VRTLLAQLRDMRDMMECRRVKPLLQSYLDGHIGERDAVRVSAHLDACRRCGLAAETFQQIKAGLSRLAEEPDRDAVQRLERFVEELGDGET
jgi:anti-sigma factor RsiW